MPIQLPKPLPILLPQPVPLPLPHICRRPHFDLPQPFQYFHLP
jgi:hypothetical protein